MSERARSSLAVFSSSSYPSHTVHRLVTLSIELQWRNCLVDLFSTNVHFVRCYETLHQRMSFVSTEFYVVMSKMEPIFQSFIYRGFHDVNCSTVLCQGHFNKLEAKKMICKTDYFHCSYFNYPVSELDISMLKRYDYC